MEILGSEWFPQTDEEYQHLYETQIAGRYHSNWNLLCAGAGSSLGSGLVMAADLLNLWSKKESEGAPGELHILIRLTYRARAFGSLLGAILLSALSMESLSRLLMEASLVLRGDSLDERESALATFDRRGFVERVSIAVGAAGAPELPGELKEEISALVDFRNGCAHDSPLLHLQSGNLLQHRRKGYKVIDEAATYDGHYPMLHSHLLPISPRHALSAVQAHDALLSHVLELGPPEFLQQLEAVTQGHLMGVLTAIPVPVQKAETVIEDWDGKFIPWFDSVSSEERERAYREFIRKTQVKPVK